MLHGGPCNASSKRGPDALIRIRLTTTILLLLSCNIGIPTSAAADCNDTIASSPVCLFGQQCNCTELTQGDFPCGSEMTSPMGSTMINDICAGTCDACTANDNENAEPVAAVTSTAAGSCNDTIASSPVCLFGQQCNCAELIQGDYPCGSEMTSPMGSTMINDICAATCDACPVPCEDVIGDHPICGFAQLCDCVALIETYPCGSMVESPSGSVPVNDLCSNTCDACNNNTTDNAADDEPAVFPGPVTGEIPMGVFDGFQSNLQYELSEEQIKFTLTFPVICAWSGFQFYGGNPNGITDGSLPVATSGYECLVMPTDIDGAAAAAAAAAEAPPSSPADPSMVRCRGRRMRHLILNANEQLPSDRYLYDPASVAACTAEMAEFSYQGEPYCSYDPEDITNTSLIVAATSGVDRVFVTDIQQESDGYLDMDNVDVVLDASGDFFVASWTRSRNYPFRIGTDGQRVSMRWAVSGRGQSDWMVNDLQYHGVKENGKWVSGVDYIYLDPALQAEAEPGYVKTANVNSHAYDPAYFEQVVNMFGGTSAGVEDDSEAAAAVVVDEDANIGNEPENEAADDDEEEGPTSQPLSSAFTAFTLFAASSITMLHACLASYDLV